MQHRVNALITFLASNYCDTEEEIPTLLSKIDQAAEIFETTPSELKQNIYDAYISVGIETADGIFRMGFLPEYRN